MKKIVLSSLLILCAFFSFAQNHKIDSINNLIAKSASDTQKINLSISKIKFLYDVNLDSAIVLANKVIKVAKNIHYKKGEAGARLELGMDYCFKGNYDAAKQNFDTVHDILSQIQDTQSLEKMYDNYGMLNAMQNNFNKAHPYYEKAIAIASAAKDNYQLSSIYQNNAIAYQEQSNYPQALVYYQKASKIAEQLHNEEDQAYITLNIGITYDSLEDTARALQSYFKATELAKKLDLKNVLVYTYANLSTLYENISKYKEQYDYGIKAAELAKQIGDEGIEASSFARAALALSDMKQFNEAEKLCKQAVIIADSSKQPLNINQANTTMAEIFMDEKKYTPAILYFQRALKVLAGADIYDRDIGALYEQLSECYEHIGDYKKSLAAYKMASKIQDSVRGSDNIRKSTELSMNYDFEKKQAIQKAEQDKKDAEVRRIKTQQYFVIGSLALIVLAVAVIAIIQFRSNKHKQKANFLLQQQKEEINAQKNKAENALNDLKSTQAQLIQSEKMASLGELTAGIAHEIQNPLNFVNNFSEVNKEMLEELKAERLKPKAGRDEQIEDDLINDLIDNEEKINHHGKRADAIVKNMLQHSKQTKGIKEPTDINALCDEYLRLSYHGLRAKDKSFNADLKTDFDENISKINIVPQDIGRVLLNLFNNAFYAVNEKHKAESLKQNAEYKPTVTIQTKYIAPLRGIGDMIEIKVIDNGSGIPQNIIDKIFQPFFTTKPTGQGTGLGLSLAYDIITKEHNGTIKAESKENEGTTFIINLPVV